MFVYKTTRWYLLCLLLFLTAVKGESQIAQARLYHDKQTLLADVSAQIDFPKGVVEAIKNGMSLTFKYQFKIKDKKWYKPQKTIKVSKDYQLSYNRLTNTYTLNNPVTYKSEEFATLIAAKTAMETLQAFPITISSQLQTSHDSVDIQFILANDNLPSLIRMERLFNDNWNVNSDWSQWPLP